MPRRIAIALAVAGAMVVAAAIYSRSPGASPTASGSPAAATLTATPAASPSQTTQGVYMSKKLGYAVDLPPQWHQAICGNSDPVDTRLPAFEHLTSAGAMDEVINDVGGPNDRVMVYVEDNPRHLSPIDFAKERDPYTAVGAPRSVTFAGRPAAEIGDADRDLWYHVADADRMYTVSYRGQKPADAPSPDRATMLRIVRSFRFLSAAERQALPDPVPIPATAPTAQALAVALAGAFDQRDAAALERLLSPCAVLSRQQAGGSAVTRQRYVADLRTQFGNGLSVTVDTSVTSTDMHTGDALVRSRWNATPPGDRQPPPTPGQALQNVDLMLGHTTGGLYWRGTLLSPP